VPGLRARMFASHATRVRFGFAGRFDSSRRTAPHAGLTETEQRIATLVRAGQTNDEVARALSLSTKTVAWNLTKVYRKLGVHSRTQLAALPTGPDPVLPRP